MTFTPENITALIGGLVVLVGALGVAASKIIEALAETRASVAAVVEAKVSPLIAKVDETLAETKVVKDQVGENLAETKVVKGHVNSAATEVKTEMSALLKEMGSLRDQLGDEKQRSARLEASMSSIAQSAKVVEAGVNELNGHAPAEASLKKIDKNTSDTAKNTARTDAAVEELKDKR